MMVKGQSRLLKTGLLAFLMGMIIHVYWFPPSERPHDAIGFGLIILGFLIICATLTSFAFENKRR